MLISGKPEISERGRGEGVRLIVNAIGSSIAHVTTEQRQFARKLRRHATEAEDILWSLIRNRQIDGLKFRRQVPLLGYTVDFLCIERRLIIELDGRQHGWEHDYDSARTEEIERHGFKIIRFTNAEAIGDRDAVIAAIRKALSI